LIRYNPKLFGVATFKASVSRLEGERKFSIVMNAFSTELATDIDNFITNFQSSQVTSYGDSKDLIIREIG